jgi:DNA-directed RNA polymerase subunit RPC12/RpoP
MKKTKEEIRKGFLCMDCGKDIYKSNEYYTLLNKVWHRICPTDWKGILCLTCVEKRLGRKLHRDDFLRCTNNTEQAKVCPELAERLL